MSKDVVKSEALADPQGATDVGVNTTGGLDGPKVQNALQGLLARINARLFGVKYEGGSTLTYQKYLNFKGNVAVTNNAGLESTDVEILEQDFRYMNAWSSASVAYNQDDFATNQGGLWHCKLSHTSSPSNGPPTLPTKSNTWWDIAAEPGAPGAGPGGAHGVTHTSSGADPVPNATTAVSGLLASADKTKLDGIATGAKADHGALTGLSDDDHTLYALADGTRIALPTSVSSPTLNQPRLNGSVLERWNGSAWVPLEANANPATPLNVDTSDMAPDRSIIEHWTSLAHPATAIEGQVIYESDTDTFVYNTSTNPSTPSFTSLVPSSLGAAPPYTQQVGSNTTFVAWGDGDPSWAARAYQSGDLVGRPQSNEVGTVTVRLVRFRLPRTLVVSSAKTFTRSTDSFLRYRFGIYRVSDGAKLWDSTPTAAGTSQTWKVMTSGLPQTLEAGVDYWLAFSNLNNNTTAHFYSLGQLVSGESLFSGANSPLPGKGAGIGDLAKVATTGGVLPDPLGTPLAADWSTSYGTLPLVFLEGAAT